MITFKLRRIKIGTTITTIDRALPVGLGDQYDSIAGFCRISAKVLVSCSEELPPENGLELIKTGNMPTVKNALATYIQRFRGNEGVIIANPEVILGPDMERLIAYLESQKYDLTWACHINSGTTPRVFIMSAQVLNHIWNDIDDKMTFTNDYQSWMHAWFQRLLRHRYFDGSLLVNTKFYSEAAAPVEVPKKAVKKTTVRKVKLANV